MPTRPDPPVQIRRYLTVSKRQGIGFEDAWKSALQRTVFPHDKKRRQDYYAAIKATRWAFEAAFRDEDVPGGPALLRLAEWLEDLDDHDPNPIREPPVVIDSVNRGRKERDLSFVDHLAKAS